MIKNKKKVLIFSTNYFPQVGGAEIAIREICQRLSNNEYHLITAKFEKNLPSQEKIENIQVYRVGFGYKIDKYLFFFLAQFKAHALNIRYNFDICWGIMASYAGLAAWIFKKLHPQVKFLLTLQSGDSDKFISQRTWWWKRIYQKIYRDPDYIQSISLFLINRARKYGFKGENIELVPNGVDIQNFSEKLSEEEKRSKKKELSIKENNKVIISISRLAEKNGLKDLIDSLKYLSEEYKLIICGIGPLENNLKLQAETQGFAFVPNKEDRVIFVGLVDYKDLYKYLNISDVFCRPSLSEGLGNVFLEAMTAQVPVIATPVGGISDFLKDKETGLFCKVNNPQSIAEKVKLLMENNELRNKIIQNGYEMVINNYSWKSITGKMQEIFNKL